jgi:endosialidase-like protein
MVDWFGGATAGDPNTSYTDNGQIHDIINSGIRGIDNRGAPQAGYTTIDPTQQGQFRDLQMGQANRLNAIASGQQMGAGEMAVRRAAADAYARQVGMANMQRGGAAPYAGLAAARNQVAIQGNAAGQAQQAALGDQSAANAQLTGALAQGRGADVNLATSQAQLNQGANLANLDAQLRQTGMNDQARLQYLQQLTGMNQAELNARMQAYQAQKSSSGLFGSLVGAIAPIAGAGAALGLFGGGSKDTAGADPSSDGSSGGDSGPITDPGQVPDGGGPNNPTGGLGGETPGSGGGNTGDTGWGARTSSSTSGLTAMPQQGTPPQQVAPMQRGQGLPQSYGYQQPNYGYQAPVYGYQAPQQQRMYMASDERLKDEVTDARSEVDEMLDALAPKSYVYKDEKHGKGRRAGIMAQDLERSTAGKRIVDDTPEGKMLDINKALSAALAASARLNERVRKLEGKRAP